MTGQAELDVAGATTSRITELQGAVFMNIGIIAGSYETVAAKIDAQAEAGMSGMMFGVRRLRKGNHRLR